MGAEVSTEGGLDPLGLGAAEDPKAKAKKPKPKKKKKKVVPEGEEGKKVVKPSLKKPKKGAPKVDLDSPPMVLLEKIRSLARKPEFCDCIFFVGDKEFQGVRALIALQSAPLKALLYKDSAKIGSKTAVEISDVDPLIFRVFIDFLHTGRLAIPCRTVSSESVIPALKSLASRFEVTSLTRALAELQEDDLDADNVLPLLLLARKYGDIELVEDCIHFIKYNAEYLFNDKQFIVDCPKDLLHELVACDDLGAKESTVFQGLITWGQYRIEAGEEKSELSEIIAEFVPKIRMALLGGVFMFDYVIPLGLLTDEEIINLLCYQIDKKGFKNILKGKTVAERKRPAFKRRPRKKGGISIQTRTLATALSITLRGGPSTPYTQTHDGGACIINGKIFTHYGNDSGGNRVYVIDVENNTHRTVNLPFQTHGSYPCTDRTAYVYVFEDSDSGHGNGFGRINVDTLEFERLRDAPGQHLRYSSCCFQGGRFWKFVNSYNIASYDPDSDNWETKVSVSSQGILMADPTDEDVIWIMFQGTTLSRYVISTNTLTSHNTSSQYFNLGANYPAFIMPSDTGGVLIAMYSSSVWQLYNSETNTWSPTTGYPTVSEGGHCFFDLESGNMYFQNSGASSFQVA